MDALAWFSHSILNFHSTIMLLYGVLAVAGVSIATAQSVEFTRIAHCQRGDGVQYDHTVAVSRHLNMATFTQHRRHHFKLFSGRPHALIRVRCRRWRLLQRHSVPVSTGRVYRSHLRGALLAEIFAVPRFPSPPHTFFFEKPPLEELRQRQPCQTEGNAALVRMAYVPTLPPPTSPVPLSFIP